MKKFINAPADVERQVVDGYVKAYPHKIAKAADDIVVRARPKRCFQAVAWATSPLTSALLELACLTPP